MGLSLPAKKKSSGERPTSREKRRPPKKQDRKGKRRQDIEEDDDIITVGGPSPEDEADGEVAPKKEVKCIKAFEGGFVNPRLRGAVSAHWRRTEESDLFRHVLDDVMMSEGTFFGSIYMKASFLQRTGGSMLL